MRRPYTGLVSNPSWRRWTVATGLSRITIAAAPLALVIGGHYATGSYADGAVLAGAYAFAEALAAPWQGRRLDRAERRAGLTGALAGGGAGLAALLAALLARAALPWLVAATILAAAIPAGVQGGLRAWLPELTGAGHAQAAFALDASLLEIEWLSAPALVAVAALLGAPFLGVGLMLAATLAALAALRLLPRRPPDGTGSPGPSPWRNRPARRGYLVSATFGYTEGTITVGLAPLLAAMHSRPGYAGLLLVGLSVASAAGGLAFGALSGRVPGSGDRQANVILAGLGLLVLPVALAGSLWAAAAAVAGFGLLVAPLNGLRTQLLSQAVPPAQRAQAFSIMYAAMGAGFGLAGLATGILLGPLGIRVVITTAAAAAVLTALAAGLSRGRHKPATELPAPPRLGPGIFLILAVTGSTRSGHVAVFRSIIPARSARHATRRGTLVFGCRRAGAGVPDLDADAPAVAGKLKADSGPLLASRGLDRVGDEFGDQQFGVRGDQNPRCAAGGWPWSCCGAARRRPQPGNVRTLLELYGVTGAERDGLIQLAREARQPGWWHSFRDVLPTAIRLHLNM